MALPDDDADDPDREPAGEPRVIDRPRDERRPEALTMTVVRRADGADRCTIYPPEATGIARMSTWISVDRSAVIDLAGRR